MYKVNFNTGVGNVTAETLEEAKQSALDGMGYTQQAIVIEDEHGNEITRSQWYGVEPSEEDYENGNVLEEIGGGFYQRWSDELEDM